MCFFRFNYSIPRKWLDQLADVIVAEFSETELKGTWYLPPIEDAKDPKGKLADQYRHWRTKLKKSGVIEKRHKSKTSAGSAAPIKPFILVNRNIIDALKSKI